MPAVVDPDGAASVRSWAWERSDEISEDANGDPSAECRGDPDTPGEVVGGWTQIPGATSAVYTPSPADVNRCLRAIAVYTGRPAQGHPSPSIRSAASGGCRELPRRQSGDR